MPICSHLISHHPGFPAGGMCQTGQDANGGGFTRSIGSQETEDGALLHAQVQAIQGGKFPKNFVQLLGAYCDHDAIPPAQ